MDIELLSRMVAELVLDHDRIGLPGMGSFVAEVVPASFADRGYSINPPYRRLSFHAGYPTDDLLATYYAESNSIELAEAKAILADYISQMKEVLKSRKTIIFPGLGRLRATKDNTFFFVQNEDLDIFPEGITLAPVSLKTHVESPEEVAKAVSSLSAMIAAQPVPSRPLEEPAAPAAAPSVTAEEPTSPATEPEPASAEPEPVAAEPAPVPQEPVDAKPEPPAPAPVADSPLSPSRQIRRRRRRWWIPVLVTIGIIALALGVFVLLAHAAPDLIDSILYTPDELRIINY